MVLDPTSKNTSSSPMWSIQLTGISFFLQHAARDQEIRHAAGFVTGEYLLQLADIFIVASDDLRSLS